jgi:carbamoyl-phosphate synthase small subunit
VLAKAMCRTPIQYHVVAFDYGVKRNILRMLVSRGCKVTVLPAQATAEEALAYKPDGMFPYPMALVIQSHAITRFKAIKTFG